MPSRELEIRILPVREEISIFADEDHYSSYVDIDHRLHPPTHRTHYHALSSKGQVAEIAPEDQSRVQASNNWSSMVVEHSPVLGTALLQLLAREAASVGKRLLRCTPPRQQYLWPQMQGILPHQQGLQIPPQGSSPLGHRTSVVLASAWGAPQIPPAGKLQLRSCCAICSVPGEPSACCLQQFCFVIASLVMADDIWSEDILGSG